MTSSAAPTALSNLLDERGLTSADLGRMLDVNRHTVWAWVTGAEAVPRRRQAQIRIHLDVRRVNLFDPQGLALKVAPPATHPGADGAA